MTPRELPPRLELQCLKALWKLGQGSVREVREVVLEERDLAYTTVMTVLDRLARRGCVDRRKAGRSFVYVPLLSQGEVREKALRELVEGLFDGSEERLTEYLQARQPLRAAAGACSAA